tara:strand:+ start:356 stop:1705 length:1350 start_codon:yes stop_codon:yes gene_type:complete
MIINKFPNWIKVRSNIISQAILELIICILTFICLTNFTLNLTINIFLIYITWITSSYIIGRYSLISKRFKTTLNYKIIRNIYDGLLSILLTLFFISTIEILIKSIPRNLFLNIFVYKFIFIFGGVCCLSQILLILIIRNKTSINDNFLFIGSKEKSNKLAEILKREKFNLKLIHIDNDSNHIDFKDKFSILIIENIDAVNESLIEEISIKRNKNISILTILEFCEMTLQRYPPNIIANLNFSSSSFFSYRNTFQLRLKRLSDIIVSIFILIFAFPIIIIACLLIKIEDGGPIFYRQLRTGIKGKLFEIVKLRTMIINAENNGAQWAKVNDKRITKIGKILRKTRIDELPQLISVIKGELSLIGPRPERPELNKIIMKNISFYDYRTLIKPGLSGWAQVNYPYGASIKDAENKLSFDLYYIRHFNLFLDLLIAIKTIKLIFNAKGSEPKV